MMSRRSSRAHGCTEKKCCTDVKSLGAGHVFRGALEESIQSKKCDFRVQSGGGKKLMAFETTTNDSNGSSTHSLKPLF